MTNGLRAVFETLLLILAVSGLGLLAPLVGFGPASLALAPPLLVDPWTLVTSVYAHASLGHLVANGLALLVVGPLVARRTNRSRYHAFFLGTGAVAGVATVGVGVVLARPTSVLGASGAILALAGYLLAGNLATESVLGRVSLAPRTWILLVVGLAIGVAILTGGPGVALTAHVTGFLLGVGAGRRHLLRAG